MWSPSKSKEDGLSYLNINGFDCLISTGASNTVLPIQSFEERYGKDTLRQMLEKATKVRFDIPCWFYAGEGYLCRTDNAVVDGEPFGTLYFILCDDIKDKAIVGLDLLNPCSFRINYGIFEFIDFNKESYLKYFEGHPACLFREIGL